MLRSVAPAESVAVAVAVAPTIVAVVPVAVPVIPVIPVIAVIAVIAIPVVAVIAVVVLLRRFAVVLALAAQDLDDGWARNRGDSRVDISGIDEVREL